MGHDDGAGGITHPVEQNQTNEGDSLFIDWPYFRLVTCLLYFTNCVLNVLLQLGKRREWERGPSMGHGLQKLPELGVASCHLSSMKEEQDLLYLLLLPSLQLNATLQ